MRICQILTCLLLGVNILFAQDNVSASKNVIISKATREFRFVKGDKEHPVQIKEETSRIFSCTSYRTEIPITEFYDGMSTIDDVTVLVDDSRKNGVTPKFDYYGGNGIFYSDGRICYFRLPLIKKGSTSEVRFKKTILDPHYFTSIHFMDDLDLSGQEVKLYVPSWMDVDIKEYNFNLYNIKTQVTTEAGQTIYTYTMQNIPAAFTERDAPGYTYYSPHILILSKSARPKAEKYTYFNTLADQYNWYSSLVKDIGDDEKLVGDKVKEIIAGVTTDDEKVKTLYQWVQDNIRYIAFENGLAGFKPEKSQEVLRKKYGDCKGMANLLTVMLRSIGLDARRCWIGTRHIAYDYSTPSLSVDNHMICAWMKRGHPVFLDATEKYIGYGEIAERIQGRQTLMENGPDYILERVPTATYIQNTATEKRKLFIDGNNLKGHIVHVWKGENKEWLLSQIHDINKDKQEEALKKFLAEGKQNFEISNLHIGNITNYNADLTVEYDVLWKNVLTSFDKESYLDVDNRRSLENFKIDASRRKLSYLFSFKNNIVFETEIELPDNKTISSMPAILNIQRPGYTFSANYTTSGKKLLYRNEITLLNTEVKPAELPDWNRDIEQLNNFYSQQIVLMQKK